MTTVIVACFYLAWAASGWTDIDRYEVVDILDAAKVVATTSELETYICPVEPERDYEFVVVAHHMSGLVSVASDSEVVRYKLNADHDDSGGVGIMDFFHIVGEDRFGECHDGVRVVDCP